MLVHSHSGNAPGCRHDDLGLSLQGYVAHFTSAKGKVEVFCYKNTFKLCPTLQLFVSLINTTGQEIRIL